ncbi:unnamed protein product [Pylaiella littoralis]
MSSTLAFGCLVAFVFPVLLAAQNSSASCTVGTVEDSCVSASEDNEFFFCTDRYSWEWSEDAVQLPRQASDSLCLTMDSSVISGLEETELLVLGGCDAEFQDVEGDCQSLSTSTRIYDPILDEFRANQDMPTERFRAAAVNVSQYAYLFGGRDVDGTLTCNVDRYDVTTGVWTALDAVQETNCFSDHSGVASDDGTIYLFGGYDQFYTGQTTVVKVEVDGDDLTFNTTEPMTVASLFNRGDHTCVKLPTTSDVFCIGGFTELDGNFTILSSVERFDIDTEQWESKAAMINPRADFGAGLLNGRITVVGGENDQRQPMDDVEWYDPESDCWTDSGDLFDLPYKRLRYCAATVVDDGRIFIFGGQAVNETTPEAYAIKEDVNWYQEIAVDAVSTSAAAPSPTTAIAGFGVAAATAAASAAVFLGLVPEFR